MSTENRPNAPDIPRRALIATGTIREVMGCYGFIKQDHGGPDAFVHSRDVNPSVRFDATAAGQRVEYEEEQGQDMPIAVNVRAAI